MSQAALCSAELYSTYFLFGKNVDLKTELSIYHYTLHCTKLELCEVAFWVGKSPFFAFFWCWGWEH
jgi:hypothetical protein